MRDTSDMMEDALFEDTIMECEGDGGGLEDLVDLATDVADSSPTIRDAAERLLTLLGVDDDHEDLFSSSEDEGVELDELEDDEHEEENSRLLHQLAASLAKELKQSYQKPRRTQQSAKDPVNRNQIELTTGTSYLTRNCLQELNIKASSCYRETDKQTIRQQRLEERLWVNPEEGSNADQIPTSWNAGWDACATEALRYLVEDEGLPLHHPTVLAMKDHLELQRERAFVRYTA